MTHPIPHLDHAQLGNRKWSHAAGTWREWCPRSAEWLPSDDPPPEAIRFDYREHILRLK
jgi:hypothetical protein